MYTASRGWQVQSLPPSGDRLHARAVGVCERFRVLQAVSDDHVLPGVRVDGRADGPASKGHLSHASPRPSPSASGWTPPSIGLMGLNTFLQLSRLFSMPSPSASVFVTLPSYSPGLDGLQVGSFAGVPHENSG